MVKPVFSHDPSATAAFAALGSTPSVAGPGERVRAVVIGGGTGAPVSLRTLLSMQVETAAVVAKADDGGSTGLQREVADVTPPGDVRKCIAAMAADPADPLTRAFKYRFSFARDHTLGNLMLSALEDAAGSFPEAIAICERLLHAQGHVYPSTLDRVALVARTRDGRTLEGQTVACHSRTALERVRLQAARPVRAYEPALEAIRVADLIVLGPGSLFTSIIPNLLVPGVIDAIRASRGCTLFVCSLADMQGETWGLTAREHVEALMDHGMRGLVDYMLVHAAAELPDADAARAAVRDDAAEPDGLCARHPEGDDACPVPRIRPVPLTLHDVQAIQEQGTVVIVRDLVDPASPTWHAPAALQAAFSGVLKLCRSRQR